MSYTWIHPPVTGYSTPEAIQAWLDTLSSWEQDPQRDEAIVQAERWLEHAVALKKRLNKQSGA